MAKADFSELIENIIKEVRVTVDEIVEAALEKLEAETSKERPESHENFKARTVVDVTYDKELDCYDLYANQEFIDSGPLDVLIQEYDLDILTTDD